MFKQNHNQKLAAGFGAAVASLYAAPELSADVVNINFNPNSIAFSASGSLQFVALSSSGGGGLGSFLQGNNNSGKALVIGGTFNVSSATVVNPGSVLNPSTFSGNDPLVSTFSASATGTVYIGFRATPGNGGGVGWFSINLGGVGNAIVFNAAGAQYGNNGESVTVGQSAIPEPGSAGVEPIGLRGCGTAAKTACNDGKLAHYPDKDKRNRPPTNGGFAFFGQCLSAGKSRGPWQIQSDSEPNTWH